MQSQQADRQDTAAITAEKERTRTLARWIRTALTTLETIDPDDLEDGGDSMRSLIIDGQLLVSVVLQGGDQLVDRRKVQTANHPMRRATDCPQIDGAAVATMSAPQKVETTRGKLIDLFGQAGEWFRDRAVEQPKWIGELLSVLSGHVSGVLDDDEPASRPMTRERCHADSDGDCRHSDCPQLRDGEPRATGRHFPLDICEVAHGIGSGSVSAHG